MKSFLPLITLLACGVSAQAGTLVNLDATTATGSQSLSLGAGTYSVSVVGTSVIGAAYNGWNDSTANFGTSSATPAPNHWSDRFSITSGGTTTSYNLLNSPKFSSAAASLSAFQSSALYVDGTTTPGNSSLALDSVIITLTNPQLVQFSIPDYLFVDNWGGESLSVSNVSAAATAAPEPSTIGIMGMGIVAAGAVFRRKLAK